jgi:hypothetical protein
MVRLVFAFALLLSQCRSGQVSPEATSDALETRAELQGNMLPADGCEAHFWLFLPSNPSSDSRTFQRLPTAATRSLLDKAVAAEMAKQPTGQLWMGRKTVTIRYRETEQTATLQCGWGKKFEVRAIELLAVE